MHVHSPLPSIVVIMPAIVNAYRVHLEAQNVHPPAPLRRLHAIPHDC